MGLALSFKSLFFFILLTAFNSCGVKSEPIAPKDTLLPSYPDQFTQPIEEVEQKKKKK
ncbi:MAG: hypothetical protein ACJAT2_003508 [Bacteriovoracaceae bacterium]